MPTSKESAQYCTEQVGTPTDKPVSLDKPNKLEQNTLLGKFEGVKSEAK